MSLSSTTVSLIDLSKQLPFEIDNEIKSKLCFAETLIVSCCHVEGSPTDLLSESLWSCEESMDNERSGTVDIPSSKVDIINLEEVNEVVEKDNIDADTLEEDFHFFFFDELSKIPTPTDKDASVLIIGNLPQINPRKRKGVCMCRSDDEFEPKCNCLTSICTCGASTTRLCTCGAVLKICICHPENEPNPICTCGNEAICLCHTDNQPRPVCTCCQTVPCSCHSKQGVLPFCICGGSRPCLCHPLDGETVCNCGNGVNCVCKKDYVTNLCICGKTEVCFCNSDHKMRRICTCGFPEACICDSEKEMEIFCTCGRLDKCLCHSNSILRPVCTCDNTDACICDFNREVKKAYACEKPDACLCNEEIVLEKCTCNAEPCLCHERDIREECVCETSPPAPKRLVCTCKKLNTNKGKPRAMEEDVISCHETDPYHTYFDYAFGIHDKFDIKPMKKHSKVNIMGLHDRVSEDKSCTVHDKAEYEVKRAHPFSLDCCSAVGGLSISIETLGEDKDRFLVQVSANFSKDGAKTGTKLISIVDCNLHTLEENRTEQITRVNITNERRNYIAICTSGYYNKVTQICGEKKSVKRLYHTFEDAHDFLLEGANLVLLRYIAIRRFKGEINTKTVLMGGSICSSTHISHGVSQGLVNGKPMFVIKVDRQILEECGIMHEAKTVMTLKGHIISHEWSDNNYFLHINPLLQTNPDTDDIQDTTPLRERWRGDMQLLSDYLEFKSARKSENERYLSECEPLGGVIHDYLQTLLLLRPTDALHFTRHYFGAALSSLNLPHDDYFDPCSRHVRYYYFED